MLANGTVIALATEEFIEEITEGILIVRLVGVAASATVRILDRRFGVDVDHRRFQLLGNLRELARKLLRRGNAQGGRIRALLLLAFHSFGNNRSDKNANRQSGQNR